LSSGNDLTLEGDTDSPVKRFVDLHLKSVVMKAKVKRLFRKALIMTVAKSRKTSHPRCIVKGDYVRYRSKVNIHARGVVVKIYTKVKKIGNGKTTITTVGYDIKKFSTQNPTSVVYITEKETVKLSDEEKQMDHEILRYDNIFFGKGLRSQKLDYQAAKRRSLQWASSNTAQTKENMKFCGITFRNMKRYVEHCKKKNPFLWSKCIHKRGRNKFVSIDDLCQDFIRPQTQGLNSCIALNMKDVVKVIQSAEVFVSLSWDEDIEQVIDMLEL
jgi:hypothetical protein